MNWESRVCEIFAGVLEADRVEPSDDFFELGGHSLLAGRVAAVIRAETGIRIRLSDFIAEPTPRHIAGLIRAALPEAEVPS